ncbi:HIT family protein [Candidatus Bipolaricaulota bacterium]|nr:HIT family protein [Candidatus Bipolaricaulota bacterium]
MTPCIFCQIAAANAPASVVYQDAHVTCFLDTQPVNPGHVLVVPQIHVESLKDLPAAIAAQMMIVAQQLMRGLRNSDLQCEGINLFLADGSVAGQEVSHVHLHVIPRFANDGFGLRFAPGYGTHPCREELDDLAAIIRRAVS